MKMKIILVLLMFGLGIAHAEASTLRVTCEDEATGAEVSVNGKYKGECPIDIQVNEGKHSLKAVKKIDGKNAIFKEEVRMGDGVTKRIEISFGATKGSAAPAIQIDQNAVAQQRYQAEMDEYNKSIQSCLPKYASELSRRKQAVREVYKVKWAECKQRNIDNEMTGDWVMRCGPYSWDESDSTELSYGSVSKTEEAIALKELTYSNAESWCKKQFTKPRVP